MMKNLFIYIIALSILGLASCRKDFQEIAAVQVTLQLDFPDNYVDGSIAKNIPVSIKNTITGQIVSFISDDRGLVTADLIPGTYSVIASKSFSAAEANILTGYEQESFVNANVTPLIIDGPKVVAIKLNGSRSGGLVIREYYYSGVPSAYFYDLFIEIYNNSNADIRVDSLYLGNTKTASTTAYGFTKYTQDSVYLAQVFMVPNEGSPRFLKPGELLIVAMDGINHKSDPLGNANSPVDLGPGVADYETFWSYSAKELDAPDVPNLTHVYASSTSGFDWLPGLGGCGLVIFNTADFDKLPVMKEPGTTAATQFKAIPTKDIIDGLETVTNSNVQATAKRLPIAIDAGMTTVGAMYNGKSVRRKIKSVVDGRTIFVDTNNSSADFEVNSTPSPRKWN